MEIRKISENLSCLEHRYSLSEKEVLKTHTEEYANITVQLEKHGVADPANFFEHPSDYCGLAAKKSKRLAEKY